MDLYPAVRLDLFVFSTSQQHNTYGEKRQHYCLS